MNRAVVIGSGMGGLTAARLLQKQGMAVTVLEQHYRPGGLLHRFFRNKSAYDTGFHYCGSIAAGAPLGQVLRHLGVFERLSFHDLDPDGFDHLVFPDLTYRVPVGWDRHAERLKDLFPHEAGGIDTLFAAMRQAVDCYGLYRFRSSVDMSKVLEVESVSVAEVLARHVSDPRLRAVLAGQAVLYGVPPHEAPFGMHSLVTDHFLGGAHTIAGGGDALALALVRTLRRDGGVLRLRTRATAIEVDGRAAVAVHTEAGERLEADLVVSNLHPRLTLDLLPDDAVRPAARTRVAQAQLGPGYFGVYLQVDGRVPELGNANAYVHPSWDPEQCYRALSPGVTPVYFASAPTEQARHREPGVVLMIFPADWRSFERFVGTATEHRPPEYEALKQAMLDTALAALYRDFPTLNGRVIGADASTPLTTTHYTGSPRGAMYGHYHSIDQMGRARPAWRTRVRNVLMVGQGVSTPGLLGVAVSAYYVVGHLFGLGPLIEELRSA